MNEVTEAKKIACEMAASLLDSNEDYIDKILALWNAGNVIYTEGWGTEFHTFGVIASETDHIPLKKVRPHCSAAMLEKADKETLEIIAFYKNVVTEACNEIIAKHKNI